MTKSVTILISLRVARSEQQYCRRSRFSSLAKRFKGQEVTDIAIDKNLATTFADLFRKSIDKEQYNTMLKDAENCAGLTVVRCNQLVWDLLSPSTRINDKKFQNIETIVVKSATVLAKKVNEVATLEKTQHEKGKDISFLIDKLNDS
ncbi:hypothetical protein DPMN_168929 [Dreissena polymorpha]|uniref:Uncharacterized protein n=1 Tax=Dreissena polymorpha TaxID=45954 RepID=A0A9D4F2T9_DREPO|nr:hypothetical protein DPMN_168929 [Dreissena polymorpha]